MEGRKYDHELHVNGLTSSQVTTVHVKTLLLQTAWFFVSMRVPEPFFVWKCFTLVAWGGTLLRQTSSTEITLNDPFFALRNNVNMFFNVFREMFNFVLAGSGDVSSFDWQQPAGWVSAGSRRKVNKLSVQLRAMGRQRAAGGVRSADHSSIQTHQSDICRSAVHFYMWVFVFGCSVNRLLCRTRDVFMFFVHVRKRLGQKSNVGFLFTVSVWPSALSAERCVTAICKIWLAAVLRWFRVSPDRFPVY